MPRSMAWAGELTHVASIICAHGAVVVSVIKSTTCQRCTSVGSGAARAFRFQGLESERDQLFKIGLHGRTVLRDSGATMESFFGAADGRVGWTRHNAVLRLIATKPQHHAT